MKKKYDEGIFCNISPRKHIERKDGKTSSYEDFNLNPHEYNYKVKNFSIRHRYVYSMSLLGCKISKIILSKRN